MASPPPPTSLSPSLDSILQPFLHRKNQSLSCLPLSRTPKIQSFSSLKLARSFPSQAPGPFLDSAGLDQLQTLINFHKIKEFDHGLLEIRPMEADELDETVRLLAESFAESMWVPERYVDLLAFLVKQYLVERRRLVPHTTVMVGIYRERFEGEVDSEPQLACTAEISFDARGANAAPPTPLPPKDCPYICNMTVRKSLRRRGIGWHLLESCEELISQMTTSKSVYLHCRLVDKGPFNMYKKAGYKVMKTDNILILLTLQRRKHLMCKELPESNSHLSETATMSEMLTSRTFHSETSAILDDHPN